MHPTTYLRAEGLALFLAATAGYLVVGEPLWLYLLLFFLPDLSMLGYLAGPAVGARVYNLAHVGVWALALAGSGSGWGRRCSWPVASCGSPTSGRTGRSATA